MKLKKSESANLENKRRLFVLIGLVISLSIILTAFKLNYIKKIEIEEEEEDPIEYVVEEFLPRIKPPEKPKIEIPKPKVITTVKQVDNEKDVKPTETQSSEDLSPVVIPPDDDDPDEDEEEIFTYVEQMPQFKGGEEARIKFLQKNIVYPEICLQNGISGIVYVNFTVRSNGTVTDVKIAKGVHEFLDKEALRVAKLMPKWEPGRQRGKAVPVNFTMRINFTAY